MINDIAALKNELASNEIKNIKPNKNFFNVTFYFQEEMQIEIYYSNFSYLWIKFFKPLIYENFKNDNKLMPYEKFKKAIIIHYYFKFIYQDVINLINFIKINAKNYLNIGAGVGLLDISLQKLLKHNIKIDLVELDEESPNPYNNQYKTIDQLSSTDIDFLQNIKETANVYFYMKNCIENYPNLTNFKTYPHNKLNDYKIYDFIISIRSWCFLYDIETYLSYVKKFTHEKTFFILDVSDNYLINFKKYFEIVTTIRVYDFHKRYLSVLKS